MVKPCFSGWGRARTLAAVSGLAGLVLAGLFVATETGGLYNFAP